MLFQFYTALSRFYGLVHAMHGCDHMRDWQTQTKGRAVLEAMDFMALPSEIASILIVGCYHSGNE